VGRWDVPILRDPQPPLDPPAALLLESTYGDREHVAADSAEGLARVIEETFARGGVVIVPAFALGRTQEVLYYLSQLVEQGRLDPNVVHLDSPMAISATELYDRAEAEHDEELKELAASGADPLSSHLFHHARSVRDSKQLNGKKDSAVIVAASGMATAGRVVHHLLHRLGDSRNSVVFVGYQAAGTRGRALVDGADTVGIHGNRVRVRAQIHQFHSLSAHADSKELVRWAKDLPAMPERIFLHHGEDPPRKALAAALVEEGFPRPVLPGPGTRVPW
jgi:metallo-beta-lactamase family protein